MNLTQKQLNALTSSYYKTFNSEIRLGVLKTKGIQTLVPLLLQLEGEYERFASTVPSDVMAKKIITFEICHDESVMFNARLSHIDIDSKNEQKLFSLSEEFGKQASMKFIFANFEDYIDTIQEEISRCFKKASNHKSFPYADFAKFCVPEEHDSDNRHQAQKVTSCHEESDDEVEIEDVYPDLKTLMIGEHNEERERKIRDSKLKTRLPYIKVENLISNGSEEVQEILNNICWLLHANHGSDKKPSDIASKTIDEKLFVAALSGCVGFIKQSARGFNKNGFAITFPLQCTSMRKKMLEQVEERTSPMSSTDITRTWFDVAEKLYKSKLSFEPQVAQFLRHILAEDTTGSISLTVSSAVLTKWALTHTSVHSYETAFLEHFVKDNSDSDKSQSFIDAKQIREALRAKIIGQPQATESVAAAMSSLIISGGAEHLGISTFLGPSGVGKTYMAESISEVFVKTLALNFEAHVFNMEQYSDRHDALKLFGSGSQYVDSALGDLTLAVKKNPCAVIVFDEIEKAHPNVTQSLLTVLDKGVAEDKTTKKTVDFSLCYFVFTSNLGNKVISKISQTNEVDVVDLLTRKPSNNSHPLSPELANRLASGNIAAFKPFTAVSLTKIAERAAAQKRNNSAVQWPENASETILTTLGGQASPRTISKQLEKLEGRLINELLDQLPESHLPKMKAIKFVSPQLDDIGHIKIRVLSNNNVFSRVQQAGITIVKSTEAESLSDVLANDEDIILIDESCVSVSPIRLQKVLAQYTNKIIFTFTTEGATGKLYQHFSNTFIFHHFTFENVLTDVLAKKLFSDIKRKASLVLQTREAISKNVVTEFSFEHKALKRGIKSQITELKRSQTVRAVDTELPFINFAGKPAGSLSDVIGQQTVKNKLKLIVDTMTGKYPKGTMDVPIPKGYLFAGLPGTGKTHMARCLAAEADMFFFNVNSADLLCGNPVSNISQLFEVANYYAPSVIFLDEIDSIGRNRNSGNHINAAVVNALLMEIDGFSENDGDVFIMAATNNPQELDPALTRAGRLERTIIFDLPCKEARTHAINRWFKQKEHPIEDTFRDDLVNMLEGATIGRINEIFDDSLLTAMSEDVVWSPDLLIEAIRTAKLGNLSAISYQTEKQLVETAYHEAGHLIAHKLLLPNRSIEFASIRPRGAALGMVVPGTSEQNPNMSRQTIKDYLQVYLAGIAAERMIGVTGDAQTAGGTDDRVKATQLTKNAIFNWGMSQSFGFAIPSQLSLDENTTRTVNHEIKNWLNTAFEDVSALLRNHKNLLIKVSNALLEQEELNHNEIEALFEGNTVPGENNRHAA